MPVENMRFFVSKIILHVMRFTVTFLLKTLLVTQNLLLRFLPFGFLIQPNHRTLRLYFVLQTLKDLYCLDFFRIHPFFKREAILQNYFGLVQTRQILQLDVVAMVEEGFSFAPP